MEQIHTKNPDKGYRRIKDDLAHDHNLNVNEKRVLRICRSLDIKSTIKYKNNGCTRQAANPQHIAKNWLNRQFHASYHVIRRGKRCRRAVYFSTTPTPRPQKP